MRLRQAGEKQKKIKVVELNVEVPKDNEVYHKYYCRRCELDFAVSQQFQEQDIIACNGCREDDQVGDREKQRYIKEGLCMANHSIGKRISFESFKKATTQQLLSIIKDESCPRYEKCRANTELTRRFQAGTLSFSSGASA